MADDADRASVLSYFLYVQFGLLALFLLAYSLAIYHRKSPQVHARYMACTALTLIDPIFARLGYAFLGVDFPLSQVLTYGLIDVILASLAVWDRRHGRPPVFLRMLFGVHRLADSYLLRVYAACVARLRGLVRTAPVAVSFLCDPDHDREA